MEITNLDISFREMKDLKNYGYIIICFNYPYIKEIHDELYNRIMSQEYTPIDIEESIINGINWKDEENILYISLEPYSSHITLWASQANIIRSILNDYKEAILRRNSETELIRKISYLKLKYF